jgi:hypothetical protein
MTEDLDRHAGCRATSMRYPQQTLLVAKFGLLSIGSPTQPAPRTPAPHAVRRIANAAVFTTRDPSLTTFIRLPAEVRMMIYRLLLIAESGIHYTICYHTNRLVVESQVYRQQHPNYPWIRHGLFPAILECCHVTHREGSGVLYGENDFHVLCGYPRRAANSWPISSTQMSLITTITLWSPESVAEALRFFTGLRAIRILTSDLSPAGWAEYLSRPLTCLRRIGKVSFQISVPYTLLWMYPGNNPHTRPLAEAACLKPYQTALEEHTGGLTENRIVTWEFRDRSVEYGCNYWNYWLYLE